MYVSYSTPFKTSLSHYSRKVYFKKYFIKTKCCHLLWNGVCATTKNSNEPICSKFILKSIRENLHVYIYFFVKKSIMTSYKTDTSFNFTSSSSSTLKYESDSLIPWSSFVSISVSRLCWIFALTCSQKTKNNKKNNIKSCKYVYEVCL